MTRLPGGKSVARRGRCYIEYLHKLINSSGISAKKRMDLIGSYLTAIGIGTVPK